MEISKLLDQPLVDAGGIHKNSTVNIDTPGDKDGRKLYRRVYYLHFKVDPAADGIIIDTETSAITGYFDDYLLPLRHNNTTFQTQNWQTVKEEGAGSPDLVKIHLHHPWRLQRVNTVDHRGVAVLRLDGEAVSGEPTMTVNANTNILKEFVAQDFGLRKTDRVADSLTMNLEQGDVAVKKNGLTSGAMEFVEPDVGGVEAQGVSVQAEAALVQSHGIQSINLLSYPTGPRILLGEVGVVPEIESSLLSIWQQPGEQSQVPVHFLQDTESIKTGLEEVQKKLQTYFSSVKETDSPKQSDIYMPMVFESDTPFRLHLSNIAVQYALFKDGFDGEEDKQTYTFSGESIEQHRLSVHLPRTAQVSSATMRVKTNFKTALDLQNAEQLTAELSQCTGVQVAVGSTLTKTIRNASARNIDTIALAVMGLIPGTSAKIQIQEGGAGNFPGRVMVQAGVEVAQSHIRHWVLARFETPVLLDNTSYGLTLSTSQGALLWLGETGEGVGEVWLNNGAEKGGARQVNNLDLLSELRCSRGREGINIPLSVQAGGVAAELLEQQEEELFFDFTAGLHAQLDGGGTAATGIRLASGDQGSVTVYAGRVIYGIDG